MKRVTRHLDFGETDRESCSSRYHINPDVIFSCSHGKNERRPVAIHGQWFCQAVFVA